MSSLVFVTPSSLNPKLEYSTHSKINHCNAKPILPLGEVTSRNYLFHLKSSKISRHRSPIYSLKGNGEGYIDDDEPVDDLRVPDDWLDLSKASEESEWLRVTLHKWLDDEYCPEPTNIKISDIASRSFYKSLMNKQNDLGEILLEMVRDLESISYQESFHGAFSSANAAISLIIQRIDATLSRS